jgi:putative restriction endonuclease
MAVNFDTLQTAREYDRPFLARLWGYQSYQAIAKGVAPSDTNLIILFVTRRKQIALQQYNDFIDGDLLFWEGEAKHGSDQRIINAKNRNDEIYLFYRETHHTPFLFFGRIHLTDYQQNESIPSEFIFRISSLPRVPDTDEDLNLHANELAGIAETERQALIKSRIGQGNFREDLIRLWGTCSLTGQKNVSLLKASHIKPWRDSTNFERLDPYNGLLLTPNHDLLFDLGLIAFRDDGSIIISKRLSSDDRHAFQIDQDQMLRMTFSRNQPYIGFHRDNVLQP